MEESKGLKRILEVMPSRTSRWFATALVIFFLAQPVPWLALAQDAGDPPCCCKGMGGSCCRRNHRHGSSMHPADSGPAFSSRDCCGGCQVSVRKSQPAAVIAVPARATAHIAPAVAIPLGTLGWISPAPLDPVLFGRPPPSLG